LEVSRKVICGLWAEPEDLEKLRDTVDAFQNACNYASRIAYHKRILKPEMLRKQTYRDLRAIFKLSASLATRAINRVAASYAEDHQMLHIFMDRSIPLDKRLFSLKRNGDFQASISTIGGRVKAYLLLGDHQRRLLKNPILGARLILKRELPYINIYVDCNVVQEPMISPVGVDLGFKKLMAASNGFEIKGGQFNARIRNYRALEATLRNKGTSSAKRRLKRLSEKERRWKRTSLNQSSRALIESLVDGDYIVLERLYGTKTRTESKRDHRPLECKRPSVMARLHEMITRKCIESGISVVLVPPDFTSQRCPRCGIIDKNNRRSQALFRCINCGYQHNADFIASINLRELALGGWAAISQPYAAPISDRGCKPNR
jgi:IS605 OrfB family transposase